MAFKSNYQKQFPRYSRYLAGFKSLSLRKKQTVQAYTMIILSLLTVSFFVVFAIRPTLKTIASLLAELREKREVYLKLEDKISSLTTAQANYKYVEADLHLLDESLPPETEFTLLMLQIEILGLENNVVLETESFDEVSLHFDQEYKIQFSLDVSGSYQNLRQFLVALENLRRITVLQNVQLNQSDEDQIIKLDLEAEVQSLKE